MNICTCTEYGHLPLDSGSIYSRLAETRSFLPALQLVAEHINGEHKLFCCPVCSQYWQLSKARTWNNVEYAFKVAEIMPEDWQQAPYIPPDRMEAYTRGMRAIIDKQNFSYRDIDCNAAGCTRRAISLSVKCLWHHIEWMQKKGNVGKRPEGRIFLPYTYSEEDFAFYFRAKNQQ